MDILQEHPANPTTPNPGMNTRLFLSTVFVAAMVVAVVLSLGFARKAQRMMLEPTPSTAQLSPSVGAHRAKPSPLHPAALRAATKPVLLR